MSTTTPITSRPRLGLASIFGSTLFQLSGIFMLTPLLLFWLTAREVSTSVAGLFAACGWLGVLLMTPFASAVTQKLGRRNALWLASTLPTLAACGFLFTDSLPLWFALELLAGIAGGLRWVLAEAFIAEFAPHGKTGRYVGAYATMVATTFVVGPALLAWIGTDNPHALWVAIGLLLTGLLWTALIPRMPPAHDQHSTRVGMHGLWQAVRAAPVTMLAGFMGGFFECGLASILPLYGLALGLGAAAAALLVSLSGFGGAAVSIPCGMLVDRLRHPLRDIPRLLLLLASVLLLTALATLWLPYAPGLVWPIVALWGGAGGALYTLSMMDIAKRQQGIALVNSTSVLVLTYTLGGLVASGAAGVFMEWSTRWAFPALLLVVASLGLAALWRWKPVPAAEALP